MSLTPTEIAAFTAHFERLGFSEFPSCALCASSKHSTPYVLHGTPLLVAVHCEQCGLVLQFDAKTIGITRTGTITFAESTDSALFVKLPQTSVEQAIIEIRDMLRRHVASSS
jgi:hypothetical protein